MRGFAPFGCANSEKLPAEECDRVSDAWLAVLPNHLRSTSTQCPLSPSIIRSRSEYGEGDGNATRLRSLGTKWPHDNSACGTASISAWQWKCRQAGGGHVRSSSRRCRGSNAREYRKNRWSHVRAVSNSTRPATSSLVRPQGTAGDGTRKDALPLDSRTWSRSPLLRMR